MNTFVKLKDKSIHVLYSDNTKKETMHLIPEKQWDDKNGNYDPEWIIAKEFPYSKIAITDTNLELIRQIGVQCNDIY